MSKGAHNYLQTLGAEKIHRVVILRALVLGDLLCAVPAFRALRAALPHAEVTLAGLPLAQSIVRRFNRYLDGFIEFPGYPGLPERAPQIDRFPTFLAAAQAKRFDLAIQLHGSGSYVNSITVLMGARYNAGFYVPGEYCPDERSFLPYPENEPEVWRFLRLMEFLGAPLQGDELEFPLTDEDERELGAIAEARQLQPGEYICVHPGARFLSRRWPPERFATVADALARQGLRIVLTGTAEEARLTQAVGSRMKAPFFDLAGRTSLGALAVLLSRARLLVSNDTGVSHIAAALRVPSVIIVTGSDPRRWAPSDGRRHRVVLHPIDCRPCMHFDCPIGHPCAAGVTPEMVLAAAGTALGEMEAHSRGPAARTGRSPALPNVF
jgi:ADP-heptose:LPS heptosyltransferase